MMKRYVLATMTIGIALAGPAAAQIFNDGNGTTLIIPQRQPTPAECAAGIGTKRWAFTPQQKRCKQLYERQQSIGPLIAEGRCVEARDIALRAGDLSLAQQVASLCVEKPLAAPQP